MFLPPPAFSVCLPVTITKVYKCIFCHILKVTKFRPWQAAQGTACQSWELSPPRIPCNTPRRGGHRSERATGHSSQPQLPQQGMQGEAASKIAQAPATKGLQLITSYLSRAQRQMEGSTGHRTEQPASINLFHFKGRALPAATRLTGSKGCSSPGERSSAAAGRTDPGPAADRQAAHWGIWYDPTTANYRKGLCPQGVGERLPHGYFKMVQIITTSVLPGAILMLLT